MRKLTARIFRTGSALSLGAGLVAGTGFMLQALWFLTPLGLSVFLYVLWTHARNWKQALLYGTLFGFLVTGASVFWFWDVNPFLAGFGIPGPEKPFAAGIIWLYATILLTLPIPLFSPLLARLKNSVYAGVIVAFLWVLIEEMRMWTFLLGNYLPGAALGPHFSFASLGVPLTEQSALLQLAYPFGVRALSGASALFASTVALLASDKRMQKQSTAIAAGSSLLLLCLIPFSYAAPITQIPSTTVALVTTDTEMTLEPVERASMEAVHLLDITRNENKPDIIVFPEGFGLGAFPIDRTIFLAKLFPDRNVLLIDSTLRGATGYRELTYATSGGALQTHDKAVLTPVGEYIPSFIRLLSAPFHLSPQAEALRNAPRTVHGTEVRPFVFGDITVGALLCSELLSTSLYRELNTGGATLFVNAANHEWFGHSRLFQARTLSLARVHAVQNRTYFVVADANAPSFVLDPYGTIIDAALWEEPGVLYVTLP